MSLAQRGHLQVAGTVSRLSLVHVFKCIHHILSVPYRVNSINLCPEMRIELTLKPEYVGPEITQNELEDAMHDVEIRSIRSTRRRSENAGRRVFTMQRQTIQSIEKIVNVLTDLFPVSTALLNVQDSHAHQALRCLKCAKLLSHLSKSHNR